MQIVAADGEPAGIQNFDVLTNRCKEGGARVETEYLYGISDPIKNELGFRNTAKNCSVVGHELFMQFQIIQGKQKLPDSNQCIELWLLQTLCLGSTHW